MARTSFAEKPSSLRVLGIIFVAILVFFVWVTYAFFNKTFVKSDDVTLLTTKTGSSLPKDADVKLRGMIVGSVKDFEPTADGVKITLAIKPDDIGRIPRDVSARIIPKTLFGEKYVSLVPDANRSPESLKAGDTITRANVPIEVEELLNDLYPLLDAVDPANLSYTLSAVAQALDGRGAKLGQTLVKANSYLRDIDPDVPQLVQDVIKLGTVSDGYADAMPEIGRLLKNSVTTGNTIVAKRTQLAAFFDEGTRLANTLTKFTKDNGSNLEKLAFQNSEILGISAQYSSAFPCFLGGMSTLLPRLDSVFRGNTVHIDLKTLAEQPTPYERKSDGPDSKNEAAVVPSFKVINSTVQADPNDHSREQVQATDPDTGGKVTISNPRGLGAVCDDLSTYAKGGDPLNGAIYPGPNPAVYKLVGLKSSHNDKFGTEKDFERAAVSALSAAGYYSPSLDAQDSADQATVLKTIAAKSAGVDVSDVPDVASILLSPVIRGSEVTVK